MRIVLDGPVAQPGAAILPTRLRRAAEIVDVDHGAADDRAISTCPKAQIPVSVDFDASPPRTPQLQLVHLPAAGLDALDLCPSGAASPRPCHRSRTEHG